MSGKIKVTISAWQVVNYTQEVEVTDEELNILRGVNDDPLNPDTRDIVFCDSDDPAVKILDEKINHSEIYNHEEYVDFEIMEDEDDRS